MADKDVSIKISFKTQGANTTIKGVAKNFKDIEKQVSRMTDAIKLSNNQLKAVQKNTSKINYGFKGIAGSILKARAAMFGLSTASKFVANSMKLQLKAAEDIKMAIAANASIITSVVEPVGNLANTYKLATTYAGILHELFVDINKNTLATVTEMEVVNRELLKAGILLDYNNQKQIQGFESLVNAVAIFTAGMPDAMNQFRQETNAVLNGLAGKGREVSNFLKDTLGASWRDLIKDWKASGTLLENLGKILSGFSADVSDLTNTWRVQKSTMMTILTEIFGRGFEPAYKKIVDSMKGMNEFLIKHKNDIIPEIQNMWERIANTIWTAAKLVGVIASPVVKRGSALYKALGLDAESTRERKIEKARRVYATAEESSRSFYAEGFGLLKTPATMDDPRVIARTKRLQEEATKALLKIYGIEDGIMTLSPEFLKAKKRKAQEELTKQQIARTTLAPLFGEKRGLFDMAVPSREQLGVGLGDFSSLHRSIYTGMQEEGYAKAKQEVEDLKALYKEAAENAKEYGEGLSLEFLEYMESLSDSLKNNISDWLVEWTNGVVTAEQAFKNFTQSVSDSFQKMIADMLAEAAIKGIMGLLINVATGGAGGLVQFGMSMVPSFFGFASGTDEIQSNKLAMVHKGETIVPKQEAAFLRSGKLALVSASNAMSGSNSNISALTQSISEMATRPIMNVFDFGEDQMIQFSRHLDVANFRRSEMRI